MTESFGFPVPELSRGSLNSWNTIQALTFTNIGKTHPTRGTWDTKRSQLSTLPHNRFMSGSNQLMWSLHHCVKFLLSSGYYVLSCWKLGVSKYFNFFITFCFEGIPSKKSRTLNDCSILVSCPTIIVLSFEEATCDIHVFHYQIQCWRGFLVKVRAHHFFVIYAPPEYVAFYITGIDIRHILFKSLFRCHSHIKFIRTHSHEKLTLIRTYVAKI